MTSIESIINRQLLKWEQQQRLPTKEKRPRPTPDPIVTVSRQTGSRGSYFASRLAAKLDYQRLHRGIVDELCRSSGYRKRIFESLDEQFRGKLHILAEALVSGQSVDHSDYFQHLTKTTLSMSRLGGVILMGRGGSFILGPERGFHIRMVAPTEKRIENLVKYCQLSQDDAKLRIEKSDKTRSEFISRLFHADINDPLHYDMVINSAFIDVEELVEVTKVAISAKAEKLTYLEHDPVA